MHEGTYVGTYVCTIMCMAELLSVRELRDNVRDVIDRAQHRGIVFEIGAHRRTEVVVVGIDRYRRETVPESVLNYMLLMAKDYALRTMPGRGAVWTPGGDPFGSVLGWLWASGRRDQAALAVADVIAQARSDCAQAGRPRPAFSDLLGGLPFGLFSEHVPEHDIPEFLDFLRTEVPKYAPGDLESA